MITLVAIAWTTLLFLSENGSEDEAPNIVKRETLVTTTLGDELPLFWLQEPGAPMNRPTVLIVGGLGGGEEESVQLLNSLVSALRLGYGEGDDEITTFFSRLSLVVLPSLNPSGLRLFRDFEGPFYTNKWIWPESFPWNGVPWDDDGDGRVDEDPPFDINGDGVIGEMRRKEPWGKWREEDAEEGYAHMVQADFVAGEEGGWTVWDREGADKDGDGVFAEDGVGGIAPDRNFPYRWARDQEVGGGGPFAASEPEVRATVDFLLEHPEIVFVIVVRDLGGGLAFPLRDEGGEKLPDGDKKAFEAIGKPFIELTPYNSVFQAKEGPSFWSDRGTFLDWAYAGLGRWAVMPGLWTLPVITSVKEAEEATGEPIDVEEEEDESERFPTPWHQIKDEEWVERYGEIPWTEGSSKDGMEARGWPRFGRNRMPYEENLNGILTPWVLSLPQMVPTLQVAIEKGVRLGKETVRLEIRVWNDGLLATDPEIAASIRESTPVRVDFPEGKFRLVMGEPHINLGLLKPGESKEFTWIVSGRGVLGVAPFHPRSFSEPIEISLSEVGE
ncbi:hypothetical protein H8D30_02320 [bacterium]|nr:hypothetical protein [bacterium]